MADYKSGENPFANSSNDIPSGVNPFGEQPQQSAPQPQSAREILEQHMGPSDFTKSFASTPARMLKSGMQMVGAGDYVPEFVSNAAAEGDKSIAGRIAGDVAGTGGIRSAGVGLAQTLQRLNEARGVVPAVARTAEAATYGAGQGAITTPDQQADAAKWGAAGGAGGQMLGRVVGGVVRPTAAAQPLVDAGVALTPGQAAGKGSAMKWLEEQASSLPVAGHAIRNAQGRAVADANVAAAQSVARLVDDKVKLGQPPREAIEQTRELIGKTYDNALEGMTVPGFVPQAYLTATRDAILKDFPMMEKKHFDQMGRYVEQRVSRMVEQNKGVLTGDMLKQIDSEIGQQIRNLRSSTNAADKTAAPAWAELQQAIREVMEQSNATPEQLAQLKTANAAYRQLLALEKSMLPGNDTFTPRRLKATLEKMNIQNTDLNRISRSMSETLPNSVPNSGTAERLLTAGLPALLMGGGAGAQQMGYGELGAGMMAAGALGSRPGARMMTGGYGWQPYAEAAIRALRGAPARPPKGNNE